MLAFWSVLALLCGDLLLVAPFARAQEERTGIATESLDIWEQRSRSSNVLMTVPAGTRLTITGRARKGFYPVSFAGLDGWTLTGSVAVPVNRERERRERRRPAASGRNELRGFATDNLNLRSGPNEASRVRAIVPSGRPLELTGVEEDGYVAVVVDGETGWVAKEYVREQDEPRDPSLTLRGDPREMTPQEIIPFIYAAADYYGQPREDMLRVAQCESDLVPMAVNSEGGSYGIFQFKTGTWLSTPYADYDIFDPRASAFAAGWMWSVGRRNEWVCQ